MIEQICFEKTDEELVILTLKNQDYYACLIKRYEKKLTQYVKRITDLSPEDIQDIIQEVFIKTYQNLNDFDQELKFSSWIYRIAHNEAINHIRKIKYKFISSDNEDKAEILEKITAETNIEYDINLKFFRKNIQEILQNLDKKYKEVLILKYLEDKDYKEISDILQKPMGTIATLINRAKKKFKAELEKNKSKLDL